IRTGIIERDDWADLQRRKGHEVAALRAGNGVAAVRARRHVFDHTGSDDAIAVLAIADIRLAEEAGEIDTAIGAYLPAVIAVARCVVAKGQFRAAVIAGNSNDAHRKAELGANRGAKTAHLERTILHGR